MVTSQLTSVYDEFLDFLVEQATPRQILEYRVSEAAQARAVYLTERNKNGSLTPDERAELDQMLELDLLLAALKARALKAAQVR